ncbi:hypothetical protein MMC27_000858 [Xylographa pallens]|nr:hypothetical protein [Xylographa pallens]
MPSLLDIPPELRFQIIGLVLCNSRTPPQDPATASHNRIQLHDIEYASWNHGPEHTLYEMNGCTPNSLSLLLTNRQLWAETQSALQAFSAKQSYSLDVMLVNEQELWPTWVSVPALWTRLDSVIASFRICNTKDSQGRSQVVLGNGGPSPIVWCFYSLMERFLTYGPVGQRRLGCQDRNITVKSITLDIVSSPDVKAAMTEWGPNYSDWYLNPITNVEGADWALSIIMQTEWFVEYLHEFITPLLRMSYHTARYAMILYERIGTIRLCADGELMKEYDLGKMLAALQRNDAAKTFGNIARQEDRVPFFREWKRKTLVKRREMGLSVIDSGDSELMGS